MARRDLRQRLVEAALAYPGASENFPWGERVAKVNKKIFVFLGADDGGSSGMAIKLPESSEFALSFPNVAPSAYGLAKTGRVRIELDQAECPAVELLLDWLDESYRAVAPKRLVAELDKVRGP